MRHKGTSFVALVALVASGLTYLEIPTSANAAIVTSNLVLNLDASNTSSLAASGATGWNSVSPASSTATSTFFGNAARVSDSTGASIAFDGTSDAAVFPVGTAQTPGAMTLETWIKPGDLRIGWNVFASRWFSDTARTGAGQDWHLAFYGTTANNIKFQLNTAGSTLTSTTTFPTTSANKWYHLAVTTDASNNTTLWVNGVAETTAANYPHTNNSDAQLHVGDVGGSTSAITGNMSRFRIYNSALTPAQMAQNFLTDSANYGYAPANTVVPTFSGVAKVGTALTTNGGTWGVGDSTGTTTAYKWQTSTNGSTGWTDIAGATSASYTPVANDATNYLRLVITKTNAAGSGSVTTASSPMVQTSGGTALVSGGNLTGLTTTVPNDSTIYNVTLATNNLSATMRLGTTTGLTIVNGYASTASYMASTIGAAAPIISFRGAGTAINTALATVAYTSATKQVDVVKLYYATAGTPAYSNTADYIPIYDNGQLTFHYYAYKFHASGKNRADMDAALVGLGPTDNVQMPGPWYLATPRYQVEWEKIKVIVGQNQSFMGARADANSTNWYWPANTDGYSSATTFGTQSGNTVTATSNIYNGSNTTLPFHSGEPNGGTSVGRSGFFYIAGGNLGWDDVFLDNSSVPSFTMETYGTAPFNSGSAGTLAQTVSVVASYADAPTGVTQTVAGTGSILVTWTPTTAATTGATMGGNRIEYSTSSSFSPVSAVIVSGSDSSGLITGLTANTQYYVRVLPVTTAGWGTPSAGVAVTTKSTATTINIVSTGGGVAGTDYTLTKGYFIVTSSNSIDINASDVQTALASGATTLAADNVNVSSSLTWSSPNSLRLGNGTTSSVSVNSPITSTGGNAFLHVSPASYNLDVKNGARISITGANARVYIGGVQHTLITTEAQLAALTSTTGSYAIATTINLANTYNNRALVASNGFAGTIDGLGNTVNNFKLNVSTADNFGLVQKLAGGTIRNLGVTNFSGNVAAMAGHANIGAIVGQSTGGTLEQVWSTGFLDTATGATIGGVSIGGLLGNASAGTTNITKSWSSVNITTSRSTNMSSYYMAGSLVGSDVATPGQTTTAGGGNITMSQVYSTGGLNSINSTAWQGHGGLLGLHFSNATISITDAFFWTNFVTTGTAGVGGLIGNSGGATPTITNAYTVYPTVTWSSSGAITRTNVQTGIVAGAAVSAQNGTNWVTDATNGTYLKNLAKPYKNLYVQVAAPANGAYSGISAQVVDGASQVQDLATLNLSTTGTPVFKQAGTVMSGSTAKGTYDVIYDSGLTLGGSGVGLYTFNTWPLTTSVTISRFSQTFTWSPTTAINFGSGTFTPSAAPVSSASSTISYAVTSAGTTGCVVNPSTGAVSYTSSGSCEITATAAQTTDYASATVAKTFVIGDAATAPTVTAEGSTSNSIVVSWTAPTVNASTALTSYEILYSSSADMSSPTTINTGNTGTARMITGLSSGTYYFKVRALGGSNWVGPFNATAATGSPKTFSTTITVVASGGGTLGTDYKIANGIVYTTNATANVNVADIQSALLTNDVTIASGNIVIDTPITWATSEVLTLGTTADGALSINETITASGVSGGLVITPTNYTLRVKTGAEILLTGASTTLSIGGNAYTLIRSTADLGSVTASGRFALAQPIAYSTFSTALTAAPINQTFTGTFDGLGNTVDRMIISPTATGNFGFMNTLADGGVIRNLGVTNTLIAIGSGNYRVGAIAGGSTGGTMDQVWSTGLIKTTTTNAGWLGLGGLVGNATAGTLTISKSWSSVNINSSTTATTVALEQGGIIGGNESSIGSAYSQTGAVVKLDQVYATGTLNWASNGHRGIGGLFGLHYNTTSSAQTITDSFSWVTFAAGVPANNSGGIFGVAAGSTSTVTRSYQTTIGWCVAGGPLNFTATPSCDTQQTAGSNVSGITGAAWTTANGTTLANVATPTKRLFVKVVAPTNGAYTGITYSIVDGSGTAVTLSSLNLSVSGTPAYSIASDVLISATAYKVDYLSGLTLGGSAAALYSLALWPEPTSVTISKYPQTVTWAPTTALSFGSGTVTPAAASASGGTTITYGVTNAGTTGCSVNASTGAITYTRGGDCAITATAANSGNYLSATASATFTIAEPATAPTVSVVRSGTGALSVGWTAPTVNSSVALTGYQVFYSASSTMSPSASVTVGVTRGWLTTGLPNGTNYYFQVRALSGSTWTGPLSTIANGAASASATSINVVTSGGGVAGTDYTVNGGVISTTGTANINAADINDILAAEGTVQLAADTVNVNGALSWSSNSVLVLGNTSSSTVNVNSTITGSGATAGLKILPSSYGLSVKSGAFIRLTGATPTFNLGGTAYTVVNTVAGLANVAAGTTWALTAPITLSAAYTTAVKDITFAGIMDGLGNTISNMQINVTATRDAGFFASLGGATVRNVGFTNVNITSPTNAINTRLGSIAGNGSSTGTNNISQVWATGFINQSGPGDNTKTEVGGLFGGATAGTLNITKSWSSVAISTRAPSVGSGGIIGTNVGSFGGGVNGGNYLTISESYSTGNVLRDMTATAWYGNAGIIGVAYGTSTTITNVFAWGNINSTGLQTGVSTAGISGVGSATISNAYTTYSSCGGTATNCLISQTAGAAVSGGTGFTSGVWQSVNGTSLVNLTPPTKNLYVQVVAPTDGSYGTMSYQVVDSTGTVQNLSNLSLSVSGTPVYTITSSSARATYPNVAYSSGLTLGGSSAAVYSLNAWITNTSVTITRLSQSLTWAPTTAIPFKNGTFTPSTLVTALGTPTITYAVTGQGATGCTVNPTTGVVSYVNAGTCTVTATAAQTTDYTAGTAAVSFVISAAPTFTIVASGGGVSGTDYTVTGGVITAAANANINASDLVTLLGSGPVQLAGSVIVNAPITWSSNTVLTLGGTSSNSVTINQKITASGNTAGLALKPATYTLDTKTGASISLSGTTPSLSMGGTSYTLVKSIAELTTVTALAADKFALAVPLTYSTSITAAPVNLAFAGTFDGLGNTVNNMKLTHTANGATGFFKNLNNGTIRNLGITNQLVSLEPAATTYNSNVGGLVGDSAGGTLDQVWTTGFLKVKTGSTYSGLALGGLVGDAYSGTLAITKSWSTLNMNAWGSTFTNQVIGGLLGGDVSSWSATSASASGNVSMNQVYYGGDLRSPQTTGITGLGGIMGAHLGTGSVSITDAYSWGSIFIATGGQYGGILGTSAGTQAYLYTTYANTNKLIFTGANVNASSNSSWSVGFGVTPGITFNSKWYSSPHGTVLVELPLPYKTYYVQVIAPTDGSYSTMSYRIASGVDTAVTVSSNFSITGTPTYTIEPSAAISATPYNVDYSSGLTFDFIGSGTNIYNFENYGFPTAVTISKYSQTISLTSTAPTTATVGSTYTLAGTASSGLAITYTIDGAPSSVCSIAGSVVTFNSLGTCTINANQAGNTSYLAAPQVQQSAIATVRGTPTLIFTSTAPSAAKVAGTTYTPVAASSSPATVTYAIDSASSLVCEISAGVVSFIGAGDCTVNANQVSGTNWNAAAESPQTFTVSKGVSTIVITSVAPTNAVVGGSSYTLTSTKTAANTNSVVYSVDSTTSTICSMTGAVVSFIGAGTCKVNANLEGDTKYEAASQVQQSITVARASQTVAITSTAPTNATGNGPTYTLTGTSGSSSSPLVFSADSSSALVCSVSGTTVSFIGIGNCVVNLNQAADANYNAATQVQQTIVVASVTLCPSTFSGSTGYCTVQFPRSGSWTVPENVTSIDVLTVGGGGAGGGGADGNTSPGGGGGGEVLDTLGRAVTSGSSITVNIGAGGTGGGAARAATASNNGASTSVSGAGSTITSRGGGAGGTYDFTNIVARLPGGAGTAGGGGGNGQAGTPPTGGGIGDVSRGGNGISNTQDANLQAGGGGGGAGGNGISAAGTSVITAGAGGAGKTSTITGLTYGGGGGGAKRQASSGTAGTAVAGGGAGGLAAAGTAGTANTGGGGGGSAGVSNGANGGSGLVVIRYQETQTVAFTSTPPTGLINGTSTTYTPTISGSSSGSSVVVTVDASASTVCSIAGGVVSIIGAGTCTLNVDQAATSFYSAATQVQQSFTVAKANQTISFTNNPAVPRVGTTYRPTATSTSGGTVTYTIAAGSISKCSIASGLVTFNAVGICTILADSAETTNYNAAPQVTKNVSVVKGNQTITFTSSATSPKVNTTYTPTATATGAGSVSFTISSGSCSIAGGVISFSAVGDCVIAANQAGDDNWNAAPQNTQTITVAKGDQTITSTRSGAGAKVNTSYTPTATSTSAGSVAFTIDSTSSAVCSITAGVVSFLTVGNCKVNANQAGGTNWNAATQVQEIIAVAKGDQTISVSTTSSGAKVNTTYTPVATSTSGASVVFTIDSTSTAICSVALGIVTFNAVGDCKVNANQAGGTNWNAATQVQETITVAKGDQTITFSSTAPTAAVVSGDNYTVTASTTSGASVSFTVDATSSSVCSISSGVVSFSAVGTCKVLANSAATTNWNAATENFQTFSVGKGTPTLSFTSLAASPKVNSTYTAIASSASTGEVSYSVDGSTSSVCSIAAGVVSFLTVGTCKVNAAQVTDTNWLAVTQTQQVITVIKGDQTAVFTSTAPSAAKVAGATYSPTVGAALSTGSVTFSIDSGSSSICSITSGVVSFQGAGSCVVLANQAGDANYNAAPQISQTFAVAKGTPTITFTSSPPTDAKVNGTVYVPAALTTGSGNVTFSIHSGSSSVCSISNGNVSFTGVGTCRVDADVASNANWEAATTVSQTFTVTTSIQMIAFTSTAPTGARYGGSGYTPVLDDGAGTAPIILTVDSSSLLICSITNGVVSYIGVGTCTLNINKAADGTFDAATQVQQSFEILKALQSVSFTSTAPTSAVVSGSSYTPTAVGGLSGKVVTFAIDSTSRSICLYADGAVTFTAPGDCVVVASQQGDARYESASNTQTFTVGKGAQTVAFTSNAPAIAYVAGSGYTPTTTGGLSGSAVIVSIDNASSTVCELNSGRVSFIAAGNCVVLANQAGSSSYNAASQVSQTIIVNRTSQVITYVSSAPTNAKVGGATYQPIVTGGASQNALTLSIASASSAICSISGGVVSFNAVGDCVLNANQAGDVRYSVAAQVSQTITVAKGVQNLFFTSEPPFNAQVQGTTYRPTATGGASGSAVVFSIAPAAASLCSITAGVISFRAVGNCVLYADQAGNANYEAATRIVQTFDITKGQQVIEFTSTIPASPVVAGANYQVSADGGSGTRPVTFAIAAASAYACSVTSAGVVSFQSAGRCEVVANQDGDANYNAANSIVQSFTVGKGSQSVVFASSYNLAQVGGSNYTPIVTAGPSISPVRLTVATTSAAICELVAGSVTFFGAGNCVLEANQSGDSNYLAASQVTQTLVVAKGVQERISVSASTNSMTLNGPRPVAVVSASGGTGTGAISWSVSSASAANCTVSGNVVTAVALGFCEVVATKAADANYLVATRTISLAVSEGGQAPVLAFTEDSAPTFAEDLQFSVSLIGGNGTGNVWFESQTPSVCTITAEGLVSVLTAGTCVAVGHKDGDVDFSPAQDSLEIEIAKAEQAHVEMTFGQALTYSAAGPVSTQITVTGVLSSVTPTPTIVSGTCTISDDLLVATAAGDCVVELSVATDSKYLAKTIQRTFTVSKATQATLRTRLQTENGATSVIAWDGLNTTRYTLTGGSGTGAKSVTSSTPSVCSADLASSTITITGLRAGQCTVAISQAADNNYLVRTAVLNAVVLDLPAAPQAVTIENTGIRTSDGIKLFVNWVPASVNPTQAAVTGYEVQYKSGANWLTVDGSEALDGTARSLPIYVTPWTSMFIRVAPVTNVDAASDADRRWTNFNSDGLADPTAFNVPGVVQSLSTSVAATATGEEIIVTGSGFEYLDNDAQIEMTAENPVFTAGIRAASVPLTQTVLLPLRVISPTKIAFTAPNVVLPSDNSALSTRIRILSSRGVVSDSIELSLVKNKLAQPLRISGLPTSNQSVYLGSAKLVGNIGSAAGEIIASATPSSVCVLRQDGAQVRISTINIGTCKVSIQALSTPGHLISPTYVYRYLVKPKQSSVVTKVTAAKTWAHRSLNLTLPRITSQLRLNPEDIIIFDAQKSILKVKARSQFIGTWSVSFQSPSTSQKWFRVAGNDEQGADSLFDSNICTTNLEVKSGLLTFARVDRMIGSGCQLSKSGKAALKSVGYKTIQITYKRVPTYSNTGLDHVRVGSKFTKVLEKTSWNVKLQVGKAKPKPFTPTQWCQVVSMLRLERLCSPQPPHL